GGQGAAAPAGPAHPPVAPEARARTTFQLTRPQGKAKCVAANGRLEIRLPRDFTAIDRRRLEAAVASMLDQLE
ncbi:replication protein, partial [Paracoccus sanguinis]